MYCWSIVLYVGIFVFVCEYDVNMCIFLMYMFMCKCMGNVNECVVCWDGLEFYCCWKGEVYVVFDFFLNLFKYIFVV